MTALTKEDIIELGWDFQREAAWDKNEYSFLKGDFWGPTGGLLNYNTGNYQLKIQMKDGSYTMDGPKVKTVFDGKCFTRQDLETILKLVI